MSHNDVTIDRNKNVVYTVSTDRNKHKGALRGCRCPAEEAGGNWEYALRTDN